ncbi:hypothetical protein L6164_009768 [Bauhinia variegata]|uniref:Uncharacterized protein n=1 Tax=Bauhinia variegata TaxID=167791 RepID=A0ACB9PMF1_BAUVA|nr:hypothetical protein L6164_009768 [Bauhinia variegata]
MDCDEHMRRCSIKKCQRVDESFVPALQDDLMEVEHLLAEPRNDHVSVDGVWYFHEQNLGKCYDIGNLPCGFEFGLKSNIGGGLDSPKTQDAKDDLKLEVLDGLLEDVKIDGLQATDAFSNACEDYLLDFEFTDKACGLESGTYGQPVTGNSSSESHSPGLSGSSICVGGISESRKQPIAQSECSNDSLDMKVTCHLDDAFRNNPCLQSNGDYMHHNPLDIQNLNELDNDRPLTGSISSHENEMVSVEACQTAALREKRFRRPTQRYIEEFSNLRSKEKVCTAATKNKQSIVKSHNDHHIRLKALRKTPGEKSICGTSDVALPQLRIHNRRLKKEELEYDEEPFASESEYEFITTKRSRKNDRRKHQRMWTLSEVNKLVDGISEYGVGRWTDIKRVLFSSTSYRTPIDLRDKWRNLLRASCALKFNKRETGKQEHALRPLPIAVLRRVRELADIHPYPRERSSKKSCIGQVGSLSLPSQSKSTPISHSKRNVRRNKCT